MAHIVRPDARYHRSYLAAMDEILAEGGVRNGDGDLELAADPATGFEGYCFTRESLESPEEFRRYVRTRRAAELAETPRPADRVPSTYLWMIEGEEYLGSIDLRHGLTDWLREYGGHVGYQIRPSRRGQGLATEALRQVRELAGEMGMDRVLVTCDEDNVASQRVVLKNDGTYEDSRGGKRRYWVPAIAPQSDDPQG